MQTSAAGAYAPVQKRLHWIVVLLLLVQYLLLDGMNHPFDEGMETGEMPYTLLSVSHMAVGVGVLLTAAWRVGLRASKGAPPAPDEEPAWVRKLSAVVHWSLYAVLFALPVTGLVGWFAGVEEVAEVHAVMTNVLLALAAVHVLGVLVHQFWWRTNLLRRMT